jgi:hypothetical protein
MNYSISVPFSAIQLVTQYGANVIVVGSSVVLPDGSTVTSSYGTTSYPPDFAYNQANAATSLAQAAYSYANTISGGSAIDNVARTSAQTAFVLANTAINYINSNNAYFQTGYNTANTGYNNTLYLQGVDNTQNNAINIIQGVDTYQNNQITSLTTFTQAAFNTANASSPAAIQASFNTANAAFIQANNASSNTIYLQGALASENANSTLLFTYINQANANIGLLQSYVTQSNANISLLQAYSSQANANIALLQAYVNQSNANISLLQSYSNQANANIALLQTYANQSNANVGLLQTYANQSNANISLLQAYSNQANANIVSLQTYSNQANANISLLQAYANQSNANISLLQAYSSQANANIALLQSYSNQANANIVSLYSYSGAAFAKANSSLQLSGTTQTVSSNVTIQGNLSVTGNVSYTGNVTTIQITGNTGQFFGYTANGFNALYAGIPTGYFIEPQMVYQITSNYNGYTGGINMQNINSGANASADLFITADNGTINDGYLDLGLGSSTYNYPGYSLIGKNDGYLFVTGNTTTGGGNTIIGTGLNNDVIFTLGGINTINEVARFKYNTGLVVKQPITFVDNTTQNTAASPASYSQAAFAQANTAPRYVSSSTAPVSPRVNDMWYDTDNDVLLRYTNDGTSNNWIDITGPIFRSTFIRPTYQVTANVS